MIGERWIKPEKLPPSEDIKKLECRVKSQEKKIAEQSGKLLVVDDAKGVGQEAESDSSSAPNGAAVV